MLDDPEDAGNLISGSSAFSKTSLNIRNYVEILSVQKIMLDDINCGYIIYIYIHYIICYIIFIILYIYIYTHIYPSILQHAVFFFLHLHANTGFSQPILPATNIFPISTALGIWDDQELLFL